MKFDILVNGCKMGTATVSVDIPKDLQRGHCVNEARILAAMKSGAPQKWYMMGDVEVKPAS